MITDAVETGVRTKLPDCTELAREVRGHPLCSRQTEPRSAGVRRRAYVVEVLLAASAKGHNNRRLALRTDRSDLATTERVKAIEFKDVDGEMLVELRIGQDEDGEHSAYTIVPPSLHPSGETIAWCDAREIANAPGDELKRWVALTASATLLARHIQREADATLRR